MVTEQSTGKLGDVKAQLGLDGFETCLNDVIVSETTEACSGENIHPHAEESVFRKMLSENLILTILE